MLKGQQVLKVQQVLQVLHVLQVQGLELELELEGVHHHLPPSSSGPPC